MNPHRPRDNALRFDYAADVWHRHGAIAGLVDAARGVGKPTVWLFACAGVRGLAGGLAHTQHSVGATARGGTVRSGGGGGDDVAG